jgi:UDP-glucose 4-epimerase
MKNLIIVTGGAGFVGSNLIKSLLKKTNKKIISLDNYSSGSKKNQINHKRVNYLKGDTSNIDKILNKYKKKINSIFHFGEFARIFQSFKKFVEDLLDRDEVKPDFKLLNKNIISFKICFK